MKKKFPFRKINTGQKYPEGIHLKDGQCQQCGRTGSMATIRLEFLALPGKTSPDMDVCAECMADFIAGPGKVYACNSEGRFQLLGGELRR